MCILSKNLLWINKNERVKEKRENGVFPIIAPQLSGYITYSPPRSW